MNDAKANGYGSNVEFANASPLLKDTIFWASSGSNPYKIDPIKFSVWEETEKLDTEYIIRVFKQQK